MKVILTLALCCCTLTTVFGQPNFFDTFNFTRDDSLRGKVTPLRDYDVHHYNLSVDFNLKRQSIQGQNEIHFRVPAKRARIQVDLFQNLRVHSVKLFGKKKLPYTREGDALFISHPFKPGKNYRISIRYSGSPVMARKPPWDGGFVWTTDSITGKPWVAVACEGLGASSWWPCKDHWSDEPDSMHMHFTVPQNLKAISNGQYLGFTQKGRKATYHWKVANPTNAYNVTFYLGAYRMIGYDYVKGLEGEVQNQYLDMEQPLPPKENQGLFFYLPHNVLADESRFHYVQTDNSLKVLESIVGPYPFPKDGYKLVEAPYWGMEHQSAIAYGNHYKPNAYGFDFIILHESGHEWFGNLITAADHADMWIHESFTTYLEALYVEETLGADSALAYLAMQREKITCQMPIQGPREVNFHAWPAADMYYKGTWTLHTLRTLVEDDSLWFATLRGMTDSFAHKPVYSEEVVAYLSGELDKDLSAFFDQYLHYAAIPKLEYYLEKTENGQRLHYRYVEVAPQFDMPLRLKEPHAEEFIWVFPEKEWKSITLEKASGNTVVDWDEAHFLVEFVPIDQP